MQGKGNKQSKWDRPRFVTNATIETFAAADRLGIMPTCLVKIANGLRAEHYSDKDMPFRTELCLNLDAVEQKLVKREHRNKNNTVDFLVGTGKNWILLVEAKIDVEHPRNISVSDLRDKITHSKNLISNSDADFHTERSTIVLLNTKNYQQLYRKLKNKMGNALDIVPMNVKEFYEEIFESCV